MFILLKLLRRNLWEGLIMFLYKFIITLSLLILLSWILSSMLHAPIILGRPFLRTGGAIIDMRDGIIRYQFPLKRGMENFPRKRKKSAFDYIIRTTYGVDVPPLDNT